jgi:chromosomal replication initiation ATPase DnaA
MEESEAAEIWAKVLERLRPQVNAANYSTWLNQTEGMVCRDHTLVIKVPNSFVAQYLGANLRSLIEKTIIDVTGVEYKIGFVGRGKEEG